LEDCISAFRGFVFEYSIKMAQKEMKNQKKKSMKPEEISRAEI
jgi:hypothetical protein